MSAESMVQAMNLALSSKGISDRVTTVGQFTPRGASGGMFAGGLIGESVGGLAGDVGDAVGMVGGALAGARRAGVKRGLPPDLLVGVSDSSVYGFAGRSRSKEPQDLAFHLPRSGLSVEVHRRLNVRVLVLTAADGATQIELEGNRMPITHSNDVIKALRG